MRTRKLLLLLTAEEFRRLARLAAEEDREVYQQAARLVKLGLRHVAEPPASAEGERQVLA